MTWKQIALITAAFAFIGVPLGYIGAHAIIYAILWSVQDMGRYGMVTFVMGVAVGALIRGVFCPQSSQGGSV